MALKYYATIADMKADALNLTSTDLVFVNNQYNGGFFTYDSADTTTPEDGGVVYVSGGRRIKRSVTNGESINAGWWMGAPYSGLGPEPDHTSALQACVDYVVAGQAASSPTPVVKIPPGIWYISATINWSQISGWNIEGDYGKSVITIPHNVFIDGPMWNFNKNNSTISRNNTIRGIYFFSDTYNGHARQVLDLSYNNRAGLYEIRTSRVATDADVAIHFSWEGLFLRCNFSGGKTLDFGSSGVSLSDEANSFVLLQSSIDNYRSSYHLSSDWNSFTTYGKDGYPTVRVKYNGVAYRSLQVNNINNIPGSTPAFWEELNDGIGLSFEGSKGLTADTLTIQQCDYGIQIGTGARDYTIVGGSYFEGNYYADIRLGNGKSGSLYNGLIQGGSVKSGVSGTTAGLLFDKANIYGLTVDAVGFDNDDPIQLRSNVNQVLQNIIFRNVRTGDTIYSYRNLIDKTQAMYMDDIVVDGPGTPLNAQQNPSFTPILSDSYTNHITDFNTWLTVSGAPITFLEQAGTWLGAKVWKKNTATAETMVFTLSDVSGFTNQVITFMLWVKFDGTINANDLIQIENQTNGTRISFQRPLRPGSLPTADFVLMYVYALVNTTDTSIRVKILTRDNNIYFTKPVLKLGFVR